jgi:hypothetical protein
VPKKSKRRSHATLVEALQHGPKRNGRHKNGGAPQLSEARKKLAKAIEERDAAKRELTATDKAVDGALARVNAAKRAIAVADKRIEEAKDAAAADLIRREMTGVEPSPLSPGICEARAARQAAQDDLDAAFQAHATLTRQRSGGSASTHLAVAELHVDDAVKEVVKHDASVRELLARWDQISYEHATLSKLLEWLAPSMLPEDRRFWRSRWDEDQLEVFQAFKAAVKALAADPNTPLPKIELGQEGKATPSSRPDVRHEGAARHELQSRASLLHLGLRHHVGKEMSMVEASTVQG